MNISDIKLDNYYHKDIINPFYHNFFCSAMYQELRKQISNVSMILELNMYVAWSNPSHNYYPYM